MAKKILLVDDCRTALMMEKMMLRGSDYEVITACNGREAVDKAIESVPDLILMDVMMPVMGGFDAVERIREHEPTAEVPIIMVTTRGEDENRERGFSAGCTQYITKPFNAAQLLARVESLLSEARHE